MEIQYLRQPGGGVLAVEADGQTIGQVETEGPEKQPAFQTFRFAGRRARYRSDRWSADRSAFSASVSKETRRA